MIDKSHVSAGQLAISALRAMPMQYDCARCFHAACESALKAAGFSVFREVHCIRESESTERNGRIDLLAELDSGRVALELDHKRPRQGSLDKLRTFDAFRIVVLRTKDEFWLPPRGIDAIISLPVVPLL